MKKILIIDDDNFMCELLKKQLENKNYQTQVTFSAKSAIDLIRKINFDLILCDFRLPDASGLDVLRKIKTLQSNVPVIIITAYADVRMAVQLIKLGAIDYITKPIQREELLILIKKTLLGEQKGLKEQPKTSYLNGEFVIGESEQIKQVIELALKVAPTDMSVIIEGETGTGKEYIARFIHENSSRRNNPFVAIDCGAIPKDLANSELFGHVKGSFTGAIADKDGVFQKADGGTLFLDEIGNLSYEIQLKFLRAIQERFVSRLGDEKSKKIDIRIIAASNNDLQNEVSESTFREDLYHRINEFRISLPPLRNRGHDILIFVAHFIQMSNSELGRNIVGLSPEVERIILNYPWHGNLRELKNVIKRSVLMSDGNIIEKYCLPYEIIYPEKELHNVNSLLINEAKTDSILKNASSNIEKQLIIKTIQEMGYNKTKAAKILNIDRKTLYNKMKLFNIDL